MIWTILKADLLWVLMMVPVQLALTLGPALWRRRRGATVVDRRPAWARSTASAPATRGQLARARPPSARGGSGSEAAP
jgi:hypothetical protein